MTAERTLDDRVDELYRGKPEDFVAARDALARQLKAGKDTDAATTVKALRKPTMAAWAVNQLAHTERRSIDRLLDIGDRLRAAHDALIEGRGDADVRSATNDRRAVVRELTDHAVTMLGPTGEGQRDAIADTLGAAVADRDAGIVVRQGRLAKELDAPSGFGGGDLASAFALSPAPARATKPEPKAKPNKRAAKAAGSDDEGAAAETEAAQRADEQKRHEEHARLRSDLEARRAEADEATRAADAAHEEVDHLRQQLDDSEQRARDADTAARRVRKAAEQAERDIERAKR